MLDNRLTIILTLKGRPYHSLRWLWHANRIGFPFKILIADGEVNDKFAKILEDREIFRNLTYEYHRYNDLSLSHYYSKCADVASKVTTPYAMMADNDDFIVVEGLKRCLDFLDSNNDYVCAQGVVAGFRIQSSNERFPNVIGSIDKLLSRYTIRYNPRKIDDPSPKERLFIQLKEYHPTFYAVTRSAVLKKLTSEILEFNFTSLQVHELYWSYRTTLLGKVLSSPDFIFYLRQLQTSLRNPKHDWVWSFLRSNYNDDFEKMLNVLASDLSMKSGEDYSVLKEEILVRYGDHLRTWLQRDYGDRKLSFFDRVKRRYFLMIDRSGRKKFLCDLGKDMELSLVKASLAEVEETLSDPGLQKFLSSYV